MEVERLLKKIAENLSSPLLEVSEKGAKSVENFTIDCNDLDEKYLTKDICGTESSEEFQKMFKKLKKIEQSPCLYYFEIISDISTKEIISAFDACNKNKPARENTVPKNSKILYVGKVSGCIWGRLIMHLGFHTNKNGGNPKRSNVHGLYLFDWAKDLGIKLKFWVFEFENNMCGLMEVIEKSLAEELKPIIGKHK